MSDNAIQLAPTSAVLSADMTDEVKTAARKLMKLAPGGNRLDPNQSTELAVASILTDLNPFNGEIYHAGYAGIMIGVAGVRRKAREALVYESGNHNAQFNTQFIRLEPTDDLMDADIDFEKGDIGYRCILTDTVSQDQWRAKVMEATREFTSMGADFDAAYERAMLLAGPAPKWEAVATVSHLENFEGFNKKKNQKTPDKWDRHERCKKRAEKWALRKRFPSVLVGNTDTVTLDDDAARMIRDVTPEVEKEPENPNAGKSESQLLHELGFEDAPDEIIEAEATDIVEWPEDILQAVKSARNGITSLNKAREALDLSDFLTPVDGVEGCVAWAGYFMAAIKDGSKPEQAAKKADNRYADEAG